MYSYSYIRTFVLNVNIFNGKICLGVTLNKTTKW